MILNILNMNLTFWENISHCLFLVFVCFRHHSHLYDFIWSETNNCCCLHVYTLTDLINCDDCCFQTVASCRLHGVHLQSEWISDHIQAPCTGDTHTRRQCWRDTLCIVYIVYTMININRVLCVFILVLCTSTVCVSAPCWRMWDSVFCINHTSVSDVTDDVTACCRTTVTIRASFRTWTGHLSLWASAMASGKTHTHITLSLSNQNRFVILPVSLQRGVASHWWQLWHWAIRLRPRAASCIPPTGCDITASGMWNSTRDWS